MSCQLHVIGKTIASERFYGGAIQLHFTWKFDDDDIEAVAAARIHQSCYPLLTILQAGIAHWLQGAMGLDVAKLQNRAKDECFGFRLPLLSAAACTVCQWEPRSICTLKGQFKQAHKSANTM